MSARWTLACLAARMIATDPAALGGVHLRSRAGPERDAWLSYLRAVLPAALPIRRVPAGIEDDRLLGGLDLTATLAAGRPVMARGVLAEAHGGAVVVAMAERLPLPVAARIAQVIDARAVTIARDGFASVEPAAIAVIACDEGCEDETAPRVLTDRLAFPVLLDGVRPEPCDAAADAQDVAAARIRICQVEAVRDDIAAALVAAAAKLGIASVTVPLMAQRTARVAAALDGRTTVTADDAAIAVALVMAPRATMLPDDETEEQEAPPPDAPDDAPQDEAPLTETASLEDRLVEAAAAALPEDVLAALAAATAQRAPEHRSKGPARPVLNWRRGRPAGVRAAPLRPGSRLALVDTLRAAAPWQPVRRRDGDEGRVRVMRDDFRIRRFAQARESVIVFCVDASGSSAFHRLGEAKGAVELLLARAYADRTAAALIAFRGTGAEVLLPPTRSLARARNLLAELPGGGGTPLAAGLDAAAAIAEAERAKGRAVLTVVLTDGRANIARDGTASRSRADTDALESAARFKMPGLPAILVDTSPRPRPEAASIAAAMGARYLPLPMADATAVATAVRAAAA